MSSNLIELIYSIGTYTIIPTISGYEFKCIHIMSYKSNQIQFAIVI